MYKIFILLLCMSISCAGFSQTKGDLFIGAGTDLTHSAVKDLQLSPTVGYQFSNKFQIGANIQFEGTDNTNFDWVSAFVKYYPGCGLKNALVFTQLSGGFSSSDDFNTIGVNVGVTGFLNKWFYLEPTFGYTFTDYGIGTNKFGFNLSCGIKL